MEPIKIMLENFFSYKRAEIDFSLFSKALITGSIDNDPEQSNGSGKSSLFHAIEWALFNKTRQKKVDDVVYFGENQAIVEFEFALKNDRYKIIRRRSKVSNESAVSLHMFGGGDWHDQSGTIPSETNDKIKNLIGADYDVFINSIYFKQNQSSLFIDMDSNSRKNLLKKMMKMERWDQYQAASKIKAKELDVKYEENLKIVEKLSKVYDNIKENETNIEAKKLQLEEQKTNYQTLLADLQILTAKKNEMNIDTLNDKIDGLKIEIEKLKKDGKNNKQKFDTNKELIFKLEKDILLLDNDIETEKTAADNFAEMLSKLKTQDLDTKTLEQEIITIKSALSYSKDKINDLSSNDAAEGECPICLADITKDNLEHIHKIKEEKIKEHKLLTNTNKEKLKITQEAHDTIIKTIEKIKQLDTKIAATTNKITAIKNDKQAKSDKIINSKRENEILHSYLTDIQKKLTDNKTELEKAEELLLKQKDKSIEEEIAEKDKSSRKLSVEIDKNSVALGSLLKEKDTLGEDKKLYEETKSKINDINNNKIAYEQLTRFFGKHGIQSLLMDNIINEIESHANDILALICNKPTLIQLKNQKRRNGESFAEDLEVDIITDGSVKTIESLSGGESFRVGLALRIALSEVISKRNGGELKFLLLDEIDSQLDKKGKSKVFDYVINGLEKKFKIMVITHDDNLKQLFTDVISITKINDESVLTQIKQESVLV